MDSIIKYLPLPEFLITRIKESQTHDNTLDKASSTGLHADVSADRKTTPELITFRLTHARFSVVLCVLPSSGQQSVRRIFHQELQPHMLSKIDIQKSIETSSLQRNKWHDSLRLPRVRLTLSYKPTSTPKGRRKP